jgi:hypothetical protein
MATFQAGTPQWQVSLHGKRLALSADAPLSSGGGLLLGDRFNGVLDSADDALTAHAGGGQGSALVLQSLINRVATVATSGDSVALPPSIPGLSVTLINSGANAMQVYGSGTDTINDVAFGTGISQLPNSLLIFECSVQGKWYAEGTGCGYSGQFPTISSQDGLTAHAGGGQGSAFQIATSIARFTTVGTAGDSSKLPVSAPGLQITVVNAAAANSMNVFPATGDAINALGANAAFALAANKTATFFCTAAGQWHSILTA